ncbi:30S ribosomal protein S9, partial [archaeon]
PHVRGYSLIAPYPAASGEYNSDAATSVASAGVDADVRDTLKRAEAASVAAASRLGSGKRRAAAVDATLKAMGAASSAGGVGSEVTSLGSNAYGWALEERDVARAPLWMLYEAQRQEIPLPDKSLSDRLTRAGLGAEIRMPMRDEHGRAYATGRRKTAVARVWIAPGDGQFLVNGRRLNEALPRLSDRCHALEPMVVTQTVGAFDVYLTVKSGGLTGQAGAIRHGLANALAHYDPYLKPVLRKCMLSDLLLLPRARLQLYARCVHAPACSCVHPRPPPPSAAVKLLQRDPRMVERKKPGQKKARRQFQWIKR